MVLISCLGFNTQAQSGESVSFGSVYDLGDVIDFYAQLLKNIKSFDNKADESPSMTYEQWVATPDIPAYSGEDYIAVNDNIPFFTKDEKQNTAAFESYSELDPLGRCGAAYANICKELMPTDKRENISAIKPTGWHSISLNGKKGSSLYNRSHLIAYMLAGENANPQNLITGTEHFNQDTMQKFEIQVKEHLDSMSGHVLYRVTPFFNGNELVARGVLMEAWSVEDKGKGICFNVFCYNVQAGVVIDYATGNADVGGTAEEIAAAPNGTVYVLNTNRKKFHRPSCDSVYQMNESNREYVDWSREECIERGYSPCGICKP
ncbi:MAG: DNA/RNA non-specific endonuclease [Firmicutes bacterium]|nr:DNA/RNA non-specific endonuclease [Bacillota bacterium]